MCLEGQLMSKSKQIITQLPGSVIPAPRSQRQENYTRFRDNHDYRVNPVPKQNLAKHSAQVHCPSQTSLSAFASLLSPGRMRNGPFPLCFHSLATWSCCFCWLQRFCANHKHLMVRDWQRPSWLPCPLTHRFALHGRVEGWLPHPVCQSVKYICP